MRPIPPALQVCERGGDAAGLSRRLLLEHLADRRGGGDAALAASAREFLLVHALVDELSELQLGAPDQAADAPDQAAAAAALTRARESAQRLGRGGAACSSSLAEGAASCSNIDARLYHMPCQPHAL